MAGSLGVTQNMPQCTVFNFIILWYQVQDTSTPPNETFFEPPYSTTSYLMHLDPKVSLMLMLAQPAILRLVIPKTPCRLLMRCVCYYLLYLQSIRADCKARHFPTQR